ncbi:MAG TPA: glycosyltransferase family 39 protein [Vicinamibacterales bacterium]|nr:glycosyltransferase family 39 protein [Vicinamibacterales bacterium]
MIISPTEPLPASGTRFGTPQILAALAFFLVALIFLGWDLGSRPVDASELTLLHASRAVGPSTPLFFHVANEQWLQPLAVYATALVDAAGGGDLSARIASVVVGAVDVGLVFVAMRLVVSAPAAAIATSVLLAMPAHMTLARLGTDAIYPTPFVLVWLIGLLRFLQANSMVALAVAAASLGVGVYSHPAAPLTMLWLGIVTVAVAVARQTSAVKNVLVVATALALPLAPAAVWFARFPETYGDTFGRWAVFAAHLRFPLDGLSAQVNWNTLATRASIFWGLLDPSFLFFAGDGAGAAPLLVCCALLIPFGAWALLTRVHPLVRVAVLAAAVIPPMIGATFGQRDLAMSAPMLASLAIVAGYGMEAIAARSMRWMIVAIVLFAFSTYQLFAA